MSIKQRDTSIDLMKALGILLMVWGHAGLPIKFAIFNMPLFFICSGYCFKESYLNSFKDFLIKRVKGLYVPFVKWNCFFILCHNILQGLYIYSSEYSLPEVGYKIIASVTAMEQRDALVGGFWFLKTLFVASILSFFIIKIFRNKNRIDMITIACLICAMFLTHFNIVVPKLFLGGRELIATAFMLSGYRIKTINLNKIFTVYFLFFNVVLVGLISYIIPGGILVVKSYWIPLFFIGALSGVWLCFIISKLISKYLNRIEHILLYIGRHTIEILTWHFLSFKIVSLFLILVLGMEIEHLSTFPIISFNESEYEFIPKILYFLVGIGTPILICYYYEKHKQLIFAKMKYRIRLITSYF